MAQFTGSLRPSTTRTADNMAMTMRGALEIAARLLGRSGGEIAAAIEDGEIDTTSGCNGGMIDIHELAEQAVHVWPIDAIEEAPARISHTIPAAAAETGLSASLRSVALLDVVFNYACVALPSRASHPSQFARPRDGMA